VMAHSLEEGLAAARASAERTGADEIMVIGGEDVFREVLPQALRIYLTEVHSAPEADTWFPEFDKGEWREVFRERHEAGPKDEHAFSFVVLERVGAGEAGCIARLG
jgi:dihydrofolate reductase